MKKHNYKVSVSYLPRGYYIEVQDLNTERWYHNDELDNIIGIPYFELALRYGAYGDDVTGEDIWFETEEEAEYVCDIIRQNIESSSNIRFI